MSAASERYVEGLAEDRDNLGIVPGLVWAFWIHEDGSAEPLSVNEKISYHRDGWIWLHVNLADMRTSAWLSKLDLPQAAIAALRTRDTHQQLHMSGDCVYGVIADFIRHIDRASERIAHLHFAMTEKILVSGRHHTLCAVEAVRQELSSRLRRVPAVADLLELIIERVINAIAGLSERLATDMDAIEDRIASGRLTNERQQLARLRKTSGQLHRQLCGLRTLFHRLERDGVGHLKPAVRIEAARLAQRLDALDHDIVELRDRARLLQEEAGARIAEEANDHLRVLSILTMLFLPPTLISGILGMNIKGLPFAEDSSAVLIVFGLMLFSSTVVYWLMRRLGMAGRQPF